MDKVYHFVAGFIIFLLTYVICRWLGMGYEIWTAYTVTTLAGVSKEVWDHYNPPHVADPWDAAATVVGGLAAYGLIVILTITTVCRIMGAC